MGVILGIDIGGSSTKIVGLHEDGTVIDMLRVKAEDPLTSLYGALGNFLATHSLKLTDIGHIALTGVGASYVDGDIYGVRTVKVEEFPSVGVGGLALATSISATAGVVSLMLLLRRRLGRMRGRRTVEELLKIAIATALAALACMMLNHFVPAAATSLGSFGRLVLCTGVSLIVYAAAVIGLRVRWAMQGVGMIKEKLHRG